MVIQITYIKDRMLADFGGHTLQDVKDLILRAR